MYLLNTIFRFKIFQITKQSYFCFLLLSCIYYIQYNWDGYQNNYNWEDNQNNSINSNFRNLLLKIKEICSIWENSQISFVKVSYYIFILLFRVLFHRCPRFEPGPAILFAEQSPCFNKYNSYFSHYNECIFCENAFIILFY